MQLIAMSAQKFLIFSAVLHAFGYILRFKNPLKCLKLKIWKSFRRIFILYEKLAQNTVRKLGLSFTLFAASKYDD